MDTKNFSIWFRDTLNNWTKGAAIYATRRDAGAQGAFVVREGLTYTGGAYRCVDAFRVFPSDMARSDVMLRVAALD